MKKQYILSALCLMLALAIGVHQWNSNTTTFTEEGSEKIPKRDRIDLAMQQEFEMTKDPATDDVPRHRLITARKYANKLRKNTVNRSALANIQWEERGPDTVSGRTRAILINGNTVWAGSSGGGLWKSTDSGINWEPANEFFGNLAVSTIARDPSSPNTIYFGTGLGFTSDIRGLGIWKTTDGGANWTHLPSTDGNSSFHYVQKMVVNSSGIVFATTRDGLQRSEDGGVSWNKILGDNVGGAVTNRAGDIEIASDGDLYVSMGFGSSSTQDGIYKSTDNGDNWTKQTGGLPTTNYRRIELACAPNDEDVVYALFAQPYIKNVQTADCMGIYRTGDGGTSWQSKTIPPTYNKDNFAKKQAWYDLTCAVDPNNSNRVIIGGIDLIATKDGGTTWTEISQWYGGGGYQYVHADQHTIVFEDGSSNNIWFGNDGGVYRTTNGTADVPTIVSRKTGYNVTQYYSADLDRTKGSNTFLAGAQDNGSTLFSSPGINNTNEVSGGDGAFVHIDADDPNVQISSYTYNTYYVTTNGWANGSKTKVKVDNNKGRFINPTDYDSRANILYGAHDRGKYSFVSNIGVQGQSFEKGSRTISQFGNNRVSCVTISPNNNNRVYFGLGNGDIVRVDNANSSSATGMLIRDGGAYVSSIAIEEGNENHIIYTVSSFGQESVFETTTGGGTQSSSWTNIEGNLPDMPVRSVMFHPNDATQVLIGTDLGVWSTENLDGTDTEWLPNTTGFANVRVDMLQARKSDNAVIAATHGRGLFSGILPGNTSAETCSSTISTFPYEESFETGLGDWSQNSDDDFDWTRKSGGTSSDGTGPSGAEDGTWYVYMEVSDPNFPKKDAILESPCFDLTNLENPVLNFSYHMKGSDLGRLELDASTDGETWGGISTFTQSRDAWQNASIDLAEFTDETELRFRFYGTSGDDYKGDICIDHIQIFENPEGSDECSTLTLSLLTDKYPQEISWEIKQGGIVVDFRNKGFYTLQENQYEEFVCLDPGCYEFIIKDSANDGICCGHGQGNYSLTDENDMELSSGSNYGSSNTSTFCIGTDDSCPVLNFNDYTFSEYGAEGGDVFVQDGGITAFLPSISWESIPFNYTVTTNTYIKFDFRSTEEGEIHAIGFDNNSSSSREYIIQVYGTQTDYGLQNYNNYTGTDWKTYTINVGGLYTGTFDRLFFIMDNDANSSVGTSYFRNVRVYDGECLIGDDDHETLAEDGPVYPQIDNNRVSGNVHAFPNPFRDELQVVLPSHIENAMVRLIDVSGNVLQTLQGVQGQFTIGKGVNLVPGMYFIQVSAKDFEQNLKVVNIR